MSEYPPVPYVSQVDNAPAANDCGPACCLMLDKWVHPNTAWTVTKLAGSIGKIGGLTGKADIEQMLKNVKLSPVSGVGLSYPYIALVRYKDLPSRYSSSFDYDKNGQPVLHWVLRLDEITYHDPLYPGTRGANKPITPAQWKVAEVSASYRTGILQRPEVIFMAEDARVQYDRVYHVISANATLDEAVAIFKAAYANNKQTVGFSYDDGGIGNNLKSKTVILHGIKEADKPAFINFYKQYYPSVIVQFANSPPQPPTPSPVTTKASTLLGMHVISHHQYAAESYMNGARAFLWMEGHTGASEFKAARPDALVIYRKNIPRDLKLSATDLINYVDGMKDPNLLYVGENESDQSNVSDMQQLEARLRRDMQVAAMRPGQFVCGEFSMGTPQLENANVQQLFRDIVAPVYNAGKVWIGFHTYTPQKKWLKANGSLWTSIGDGVPYASLNGQPCDPIWFPWRWRFLFTHCGFDPRVQKILGGETGADEGGVGGFPAQQTSAEEFERWCRGYLFLQRQPLVISSGPFAGTWPSPFTASTIFQRSDFPDWQGYKIPADWLPILNRLYTAPDTRALLIQNAEPWEPTTPPPANFQPIPKEIRI